ncbi:MAG TPA: ABC transporter permease subunit [Thermoanaerobaculaceae bacterium]|nr:ABC transporter permease subunit [Thermoanaerobaculaceae bacterium]
MALIAQHTQRVRQALARPARIGVELFVLLLVAAFVALVVAVGRQVRSPLHERVAIDLSFRALPGYTLLSLGRGFLAYVLALVFTLVYGTIAAHNRRAEKLMLPALDVLQAIPVLGFLPGLVLAMIALFPTREIGLELACVVMIFTAQAWNMTFSFHGSLRGIPTSAREVAAVNRLGAWQTFRLLEVPAAMIGLVWNSMMSMAGGWFFLTVNEAFTLGNHDYRLPGIGSYMNEAINRGDVPAMLAAVVAMVVMIVTVDRVLWRPIVVWSQKYKIEDTPEADAPRSLVLELLQRSRLRRWLVRRLALRRTNAARRSVAVPAAASSARDRGRVLVAAGRALRWLVIAALAAGGVAGTATLVRLLAALPLAGAGNGHDWAHVVLALLASFARTTAAVAIAAAWALPAGIWIGRSPKWSRRLQPLVQVAASFPAPMLFPLVTLLLLALHVPFTLGCVALMLLGAQWYVLFNVIAGAVAIPADLKEVATANGMPRRQRWSRLYVPCVFPYLVTGLVTAAGGAWNATIVSEYVNFKDRTFSAFGLGSTISHATAEGDFPLLCAAIVTMAVFVVLVNRLFWRRMYRLAEERYSLNA